MNKAKLKAYAPQARKDFIAAVTARAHQIGLAEKNGSVEIAPAEKSGDFVIIAGQSWPAKINQQRANLITRIEKEGFNQTMEAVAYTWFNRFAALRYMEIHDYLSHGYRALSSREGGLPEILNVATELAQNGGLPGLNAQQVIALKLAGDKDGELYRLTLIAQCNALAKVMPFLFERIDNETELLLPDNLLLTDSVIAKLVEAIPEEDWQEVEIVGWLYQFYISEKKDQVIGKVVKSEDIPAATQLFTPNWIVQYLVQNSVGRLWLMANPASLLKSDWPYYIEPAQQTPEVQAQLDALIQSRMAEDGGSLNPETISVIDPACGSGHILVEAYEVLKAIYLERGYQLRSIPRLILEKNLYGLDIDDRAAQLAGFALLMKARADDRRLFDELPKLNVYSLQSSKNLDLPLLWRQLDLNGQGKIGVTSSLFDEPQSDLVQVIEDSDYQLIKTTVALFEQAQTLGSLIQVPAEHAEPLKDLLAQLQALTTEGNNFQKIAATTLIPFIRQAVILAMEFDAVVANPPYMGNKYLTPFLKSYLKDNYKGFEKDLFSAFMIRNLSLTKESGQLGFMSPFVWMFISSYEELRTHFIDNATLTSLIQLEYSGFDGATVPICTFTLGKAHVQNYTGSYIKLSDFKGHENQAPKTLEAIKNPNCGWFYTAKPDDFIKLPGAPIAYWMSEKAWVAFKNGKALIGFSKIREGINTGDNQRFLRLWHEVDFSTIQFDASNNSTLAATWVPHNKGGRFRKWYGNTDYVLKWKNHGEEIHEFHGLPMNFNGAPMRGKNFFFKKSISWSRISSGDFAARFYDCGYSYDSTAPSLFATEDLEIFCLGFLNSSVVKYFLAGLSPTLDYRITNVGRLPAFLEDKEIVQKIKNNSKQCVDISRTDWSNLETSLYFGIVPTLELGNSSGTASALLDAGASLPTFSSSSLGTINASTNLEQSFNRWQAQSRAAIIEMQRLEEENNRLFIEAYGLQDELSPEVPEAQITLARADREKDSQRLISYAIGCMMGRYRLDRPGLIYAHAGNVDFDKIYYGTDTPPFAKGGPGGILHITQAENQEQIPPNPLFAKGGIFAPDADGIVPITDELWFEDDAANRLNEFLLAVWGNPSPQPSPQGEGVEANIAWLAESLDQKGNESPQETIRRYIAGSFYKTHLQTYKKRPIYWLFSSGKQGAFQALVYLHRYNESTLSRMRAEYVVPLTGKIQSRIDMLEKDAAVASSNAERSKLGKDIEKLRKKYVELLSFDEKLRHYADLRIQLDLDDGVKVNYGKFGDLLAEVKAVTGGKDE